MSPTVERLKAEIEALSADERAEIVKFLTIIPDSNEEDEIELAWEQELERRLREVENGEVCGVPGDEVFEQLRQKYPG